MCFAQILEGNVRLLTGVSIWRLKPSLGKGAGTNSSHSLGNTVEWKHLTPFFAKEIPLNRFPLAGKHS